jgi:hypothetical protein
MAVVDIKHLIRRHCELPFMSMEINWLSELLPCADELEDDGDEHHGGQDKFAAFRSGGAPI